MGPTPGVSNSEKNHRSLQIDKSAAHAQRWLGYVYPSRAG